MTDIADATGARDDPREHMQHFECSMTCGFRSSVPPKWERCHTCGAQSDEFGEFCPCGAHGFSYICPQCDADVWSSTIQIRFARENRNHHP